MKFWNFRNKDDTTGELMLYGDISDTSWWGDEVTPKDFKNDLDSLGDIKNLNIYINSGGGDVFAGTSIYNMLKRHNAYKTVYIDGLAASIASMIAMAGDKIIMPKNAMLMIHRAWTAAYGNVNDFKKMAETLAQVDNSIATSYTGKTGLEVDEIMEMMDKETWFTASEAVEKKFADEIEAEKLLAASIDGAFLMLNNQKFSLNKYKNMPEIKEIIIIDITTIGDPDPKEMIALIEPANGDKSQPVSDIAATQQKKFYELRRKINQSEGKK